MSVAEELTAANDTEATRRFKLGFLSNVPFSDSAPGGAAQGLKDAVELFKVAEELGYDSGWVRNRHFDNYLSSPLTLLAVAAQHTGRIRLGTAIIPVGYEHPIRLAEDAATVDLLVDQRLELGIARGIARGFERVFNNDGRPWAEASEERVHDFLDALRGKVLETSPSGDAFSVRPHSPTLLDRVWYGPASVPTATQAGAQGLDLLLSAIAPDIGSSFDEGQLAQIRAHRAAWTRTERRPRVSAARLFFPALNDRQRKLYRGYADLRATEGPAASRPPGALASPRPSTLPLPPLLASPVVVGEPAEVVEYLRSDVAVAEAGELTIFLPPGFSHRDCIEILENIAEHVAGGLGWSPTR